MVTAMPDRYRRRRFEVGVGNDSAEANKDYTPDELEFMKAMDSWRHWRGGRYPTCRDVLDVAKALGYRKVEPQ